VSLARLSGLQPWLRPFGDALLSEFPQLTITSVYRSQSEQLALYRRRDRHPCPTCDPPTFPVAPPGQSYHQYGRAFDVVGDPRLLAAAGARWRSWGGTWSPKDPIHFQA
jgi:hypothetical protein